MKNNPVRWIRQKGSAGLHRFQDAALAFDAQVDIKVRFVSHIAHQGFGLMCVEIVHDKVPFDDRGRACHRLANVSGEISCGARTACGHLPDLPSADIEIHDKRDRSMPNVLKFPAFDFAWSHRQARMLPFHRLNAGQFVRAQQGFAFFCQFWSLVIQRIDIFHFFVKLFVLFLVRRQPVTNQVRFETPFLSSRDA